MARQRHRRLLTIEDVVTEGIRRGGEENPHIAALELAQLEILLTMRRRGYRVGRALAIVRQMPFIRKDSECRRDLPSYVPVPEAITTPEDTLRGAGIDEARQAKYQRKFSTLLAGRGGA